MKLSDRELAFIKDVLKMDAKLEENSEEHLRSIQDAAFNVELKYEFGEISEEIGRQAVLLVTRLGIEP